MTAAPGAAGPLLAAHGLGKTYRNGIVALAGVDLAVAEGEFLSVLGPSGCGKSTLLRIVAGLSEPTSGTLEGAATGPDGGIGFVFQEPTLMPWADLWDNVYLPLRLQGVARRDAASRIDAMLGMMGLADFAQAFPRELSGGMRMRASIARALVTTPRLLLLDEPFAALDEITRFKLNEDLLGLWRRLGCTVIFVTHSVFESVFLSSRIAVMSGRPGRVVATLPVDLPQPHDAALRLSPAYAEICRSVSRHLAAVPA